MSFRFICLLILTTLFSGCSKDENSDSAQLTADTRWNSAAVRKVLHTFAYGGQASDSQIEVWANMNPDQAIQEILTFDTVNEKLSPSEDATASMGGRLEDLMAYWSLENTSSNNPSPYPDYRRSNFGTFYTYPADHAIYPNQSILYSSGLQNTWVDSINKRGLNPFRQKFGLFLTNYHMAVNLRDVRPNLIRRLYDDSMDMLANGAAYEQVLARGAYSAAVAMEYGHRNNVYNNNTQVFRGNDDFAREFHQLFFKINGINEQADYHENTTIEHTAWILTGMQIDQDPERYHWASNRVFDHLVAPLVFTDHLDNYYNQIVTSDPVTGTISYEAGDPAPRTINNLSNHHQASLEVLHADIQGATAKEKLIALAQVAINNEESLDNIPLFIVNYFADDNITPEKRAKIIQLWRDLPEKNVLVFLQHYAISPMFLSSDTYKFRTAFNRNMTIYNMNTVDNEEAYQNNTSFRGLMIQQGANVFVPAHDVFGGQTSLNAANNPNIFKSAYNDNVDGYSRIVKTLDYQRDASGSIVTDNNGNRIVSWRKNWAKIVPKNAAGVYQVDQVGEWLWNRFIGDGLRHYGVLERAYVNAFLASGRDFPGIVASVVPEEQISIDALTQQPLSSFTQAHRLSIMALDSTDITERNIANINIGLAINFIVSTPFMYVIGG